MTQLSAALDGVLALHEGRGDLEAFGVHRRVLSVQADTGGAIRQVDQSENLGIGVRVVDAGRSGYASTADLSLAGLSDCVQRARGHAMLSEPDTSERLPSPWPGMSAPARAAILDTATLADRLRATTDLARQATSIDNRVQVIDSAAYSDERTAVEIASTTGVRVSYERSFAEMCIDVVADDGTSTSSGSGYWWGRALAGCDVESVASMAVNHALGLLGPRADVLDGVAACCAPEVTAAIIAAAGRALTAPLVRSRRGPLAGGIGAAVAAPVVTLVDDGLHPTSKRAAPVDDEGVPRQRTALITDGAITGMLQTTATLRGEETSTGNAYRGSYKSPPSLAPTTLTLAPTTHEDLRAAPGDVIYISQLSGDRSGISPVSGRVDIAIAGCLLRDGESMGAFTAVPVSTTLTDLLGHVEAVGDDARLVLGSAVLAPTIRLSPGWLG